jgi:hypothetical protein
MTVPSLETTWPDRARRRRIGASGSLATLPAVFIEDSLL